MIVANLIICISQHIFAYIKGYVKNHNLQTNRSNKESEIKGEGVLHEEKGFNCLVAKDDLPALPIEGSFLRLLAALLVRVRQSPWLF